MLYYFFFTSFFIYLDLTFYLWEANYPEAAASKKAADYSLCKESGNNHRIIKKNRIGCPPQAFQPLAKPRTYSQVLKSPAQHPGTVDEQPAEQKPMKEGAKGRSGIVGNQKNRKSKLYKFKNSHSFPT
jgi:hypothetical protein